jgi:ATP-dependent RNA helicase DDX23/PRP28
MFGRGMRAGIDRREQKKQAAQYEAAAAAKARAASGVGETEADRAMAAARAARADRYEGFDMNVRGWGGVGELRGLG